MSKLSNYYLEYLRQNKDTNDLRVKWNWAAFLFGPFWLFYRGMFLYGFVYYAILVAEISLEFYFFPGYHLNIFSLATAFLLGMYGTGLFCNKCKKDILQKNNKEILFKKGNISIETYESKTRPILSIFICLILTAAGISINAIVLLSEYRNSSITKFENVGELILVINDKFEFKNPSFEEVKKQLEKVKIGKNEYAVLENNKEQFMQMYLAQVEKGIKYYHVEYKLIPGDIVYITYDYKVTEEQMMKLFYKFYKGDNSFINDIKWTPLNYKRKELLGS